METRTYFRPGERQKIKQRRIAIGVIVIVLVVVIALIIAGYWFDWTGFNGYNKVTIAHIISGTNVGTVTRTEESQPGKTLWDWLQLLIIPAVLAIAGYFINLTISRGEQKATKQRAKIEQEAADKRAKTEHEIAEDNQREAALQEYIDKMSDLLLKEGLRKSGIDADIRYIARARTLTILPRLDPKRKRSLLQFLHESGLIDKDKKIVDLSGADFRKASLYSINLTKADLSESTLRGAEMLAVNLTEADLRKADLIGADLSWANLKGANLKKAHISNSNLIILLGEEYRNTTDRNITEVRFRKEEYRNTTDLSNADLSNADLSQVTLSGANLRDANLSGAILVGANLRETSFYKADLTDADLTDADLTDAKVTEEQLKKATLKGATMPDGSIHP